MNPLEKLALRYIADEWDEEDVKYFRSLTEVERMKFIYFVEVHSPNRN